MKLLGRNSIKKLLAISMPIIFLGALNFCLFHPNSVYAQTDAIPVVNNFDSETKGCQHNVAVNPENPQPLEDNSDTGIPSQNQNLFCCVVHDSAKTETGSKNYEFGSPVQLIGAGSFSFDSLEISDDSLNLYLLSLSPPKADILASILKKE